MEDSELDLRSMFGLLQRQLRLILVTVIAVVAIAGIFVFSLTPIYSATTLILVDPSSKNVLEPDTTTGSASGDSARIDSEVEILRSDNILLNVINSENLVADPEFGPSLSTRSRLMSFLRLSNATLPTGEQALNQSLSKLRSSVSVQRRGITYLISVQVRSKSAARAAELANAVAEAYISDQLTYKVTSVMASLDILEARISSARQSILESEGSFDAFIESNIDRIVSDTGRSDIASIQNQIDELRAAREETLRTSDLVEVQLASGDFQSMVAALQSEALAELDQQRAAVATRLADAGSGSAVEVDLRSELAAIEERLRETATAEVQELRSQVADNQDRESTLREAMRSAVLGSELSADTLTQIYELQQNAELARTQYQTLLARAQDLETQANLQIADSRIVSPALAPNSASFPNTSFILMAATLAALCLGIALAFVYENFVGGFTTEAQLQSALRTRVISSVPRERLRNDARSLADQMISAPLSAFSESVRRIRAGIDQTIRHRYLGHAESSPRRSEGTVIMVTSTLPNEGKSTLALSLARSYALSGRSTLLIDCDLRKPSIHRQLNLEPSQGLLDFLGSEDESSDLRGVMVPDTLTSTTIILGSRRSNLPTDQLIGGVSFARLLRAARASFEIVVLDTPPVGPVVDGLYIAPFADVIAFAVRWANTSQTDVKAAVAALNEARSPGADVLAVLNHQEASRRSYSNKYGEYYVQPA